MNEDPNAKLIRELKEEVERLRDILRIEGIEIKMNNNKNKNVIDNKNDNNNNNTSVENNNAQNALTSSKLTIENGYCPVT